MHMDRSMLFWLPASNVHYNKHVDSQNCGLPIFFHNNIFDQILITVQCWCWIMIYILYHQNNASIAFAMSERLGLDNLILNIRIVLANIQGFRFVTFS